MSKKTITFVTGNANKLNEVRKILNPNFPHVLVSKKIDLPEYQGSSREICEKKCIEATKSIKGPVIVEDTSLCFNAMGGLPGPYIKWFQEEIGASGLHKMLKGFDDKSAYALCSFGYCEGEGQPVEIIQGRCDGEIVEPRGTGGFGFDPCFLPVGFEITFGEMNKEEKNKLSHRYKAVSALAKYLCDIS